MSTTKYETIQEPSIVVNDHGNGASILHAMTGDTNVEDQAVVQTSVAALLPTEILLQIFAGCIDENIDPDAIGYSGDWIQSLTHVCRAWREVALDYPALWTNIAFLSLHMTTSMLERSKEALITVHANVTPDSMCRPGQNNAAKQIPKLFKRVRQALLQAPRVQKISLQSRACMEFSRLLKDFPDSIPNLESLSLKAVTHENQPAFDVPQALFDNDILPLRKLEFRCCTLPEPVLNILPSHCGQLTHLALHYVAPLTRQGVLNILGPASGIIETLVLDHISTFSSPFASTDNGPTLSLPSLSSLYLRDRAEIAFCMLRSLTIPPTTRLHLEFCLSGLTPAFRYSPLAKHSSAGSPVRSLLFIHAPQQLCEPHERGLRIFGYSDAAVPEYYFAEPKDAKVDVHFSCWEDLERHVMSDTLLKVWRAMVGNGKDVQALAVARISCVSTLVWSQLLRSTPEVKELSVHGSASLKALCAVLGGAMPTNTGVGDVPPTPPASTALLLPELQTLTVFEGAFRLFPSHRMGSGTRGTDFGALIACLEARKNAGKKLERLVVCYSDAGRSDMEELGGLVEKLVWDGSLFGRDSIPIPDSGLDADPDDSEGVV